MANALSRESKSTERVREKERERGEGIRTLLLPAIAGASAHRYIQRRGRVTSVSIATELRVIDASKRFIALFVCRRAGSDRRGNVRMPGEGFLSLRRASDGRQEQEQESADDDYHRGSSILRTDFNVSVELGGFRSTCSLACGGLHARRSAPDSGAHISREIARENLDKYEGGLRVREGVRQAEGCAPARVKDTRPRR